jgi:hypothetical protein
LPGGFADIVGITLSNDIHWSHNSLTAIDKRSLEANMNLSRHFVAVALLSLGLGLAAATPAMAQSTTDVEPDITIRQEEDRTIREYRVNGLLYAIEIQPRRGPSYFLVDHDGDGNFERQEGDRIAVPQWVLIRW